MNISKNIKIIFMGTSYFAVPILKKLLSTDYCLLTTVITQPDKKTGRKQILSSSPIKKEAQKYNIPILQPNKISKIKDKISKIKPDLIIVVAYGQILPKEILQIPKYGCINVHPSLLPKYRGPSPIVYSILNGEKSTGTTIIKMNEKMDAGNIISQNLLNIKTKDTTQNLNDKLSKLGVQLLIETLPKYISGNIKIKLQNDSKATYTKIIKKENGKIDWQKSSSRIEKEIRAYFPWPGSYTYWEKKTKNTEQKKILKILPPVAYHMSHVTKYKPGQVFLTSGNKMAVKCGKGYLIIENIQPEGKKVMFSSDFLKGNSSIIEEILE